MTYGRLWSDCWFLLRALGVGGALAFWSWSSLIVSACFGLCAGYVVCVLGADREPRATSSIAVAGRTLRWAAYTVAGMWVLTVSPGLALFLAVAGGLTAPRTVTAVARRLQAPAAGATEPGALAPPAPPPDGSPAPHLTGVPDFSEDSVTAAVRELSDAELCRAWRRSYLALQRSPSTGARTAAVDLRQVYLDEVERRDAAGLSAWLDAGARPAGGPDRFLRRHRPPAA